MSGIFGFTHRDMSADFFEDALGGLEYWNRIYGRSASATQAFSDGCIGCHIEHFSEAFPFGGPILNLHGHPAVVDALLYNRDELTAILDLPADSKLSDEELLLTLIGEQGFDGLAKVNGDFAGAVFNEEMHEWTLFRDHLGVRPLYLYHDRDLIAFSTDIRGILSIPGADISVNEMNLYRYVRNDNANSLYQTDFSKVICARPGAVTKLRMTAVDTVLSESIYWTVRSRKIRMGSDGAYLQELRRLITDSVHRRCDAIPGLLGAELSGGLDSGVIDILISRYGREAVYFSWSIDPSRRELQEVDERQVILDICSQEGIECKFLSNQERFGFNEMLRRVCPPFMNTPHLSYGSKWMHDQGAKVVFTGHGGDEGVSHRCSRYEMFHNLEWWTYFKYYWQDARGKKLRLLRTLYRGLLEAYSGWKKYHGRPDSADLHPDILCSAFCDRMIRQYVFEPTPFSFAPYKYVRSGGSRNRLDNAAYQGAQNGVRYLFPYIDYRVMDFAVSIPRRLYISRKGSRQIFRDAFADLMPKSLQEVRYKDMASNRNAEQSVNYLERFEAEKKWFLDMLDHDFWDGIINFDAIQKMERAPYRSKEYMIQNLLLSNLNRAILIQNCVKEAPRWKERED